MGNYICLFRVLYYNNENYENVENCGFCFADSYAEAAKYLEQELYREDLVEILHMELLDTSPTISRDLWDAMQQELNE